MARVCCTGRWKLMYRRRACDCAAGRQLCLQVCPFSPLSARCMVCTRSRGRSEGMCFACEGRAGQGRVTALRIEPGAAHRWPRAAVAAVAQMVPPSGAAGARHLREPAARRCGDRAPTPPGWLACTAPPWPRGKRQRLGTVRDQESGPKYAKQGGDGRPDSLLDDVMDLDIQESVDGLPNERATDT